MRILGRLVVLCLLAFTILLILPASSQAQQRPPILEQVAKTYGLHSWDKVEAIRSHLNKARQLLLLHHRQLLTPEQRVKYKALRDQIEADRAQADRSLDESDCDELVPASFDPEPVPADPLELAFSLPPSAFFLSPPAFSLSPPVSSSKVRGGFSPKRIVNLT